MSQQTPTNATRVGHGFAALAAAVILAISVGTAEGAETATSEGETPREPACPAARWASDSGDRPREVLDRPTTITEPGYYVVGIDIVASADAVLRVEADHVTIDLAGHTLENDAGVGILVAATSRSVVVANGTIDLLGDLGADGSICVQGGEAHLTIEGVTCTRSRIAVLTRARATIRSSTLRSANGILAGAGSRVRCNEITIEDSGAVDVGDRSDVSYNDFPYAAFHAVHAGEGSTVRGNTVRICGEECIVAGPRSLIVENTILRQDLACGIGTGSSSLVANNIVSGNTASVGVCIRGDGALVRSNILGDALYLGLSVDGTGNTVSGNQVRAYNGVSVQGAENLIERNRIDGYGGCGIEFENAGDHIYRDNTLIGSVQPVCGPPNIDGGGNLY